MIVEIENADAVAEIEKLMARFGLSAETVVERLIIDAGCWMPMETLANSYWQEAPVQKSDIIPPWHGLVSQLPVFLKIGN